MNKPFLAWLGYADLEAARSRSKGNLGPVAEAVLQRSYKDVWLLSNHPHNDNNRYKSWLSKEAGTRVRLKHVDLSDPMDFNRIYHYSKRSVTDVQNELGKDVEPVFALSPGTPAMAAVWIILGKTCFPQAELVASGAKDESTGRYFIRTISVPFDIAAEPVADMLGKADNHLVRSLQGIPPETPEFNQILYKCSSMRGVIVMASTVAIHNVPVLLLGESGTGKELLARAIHESSQRCEKPFVTVNCGAIPPALIESVLFGHVKGAFTGATAAKAGYFRESHGGTLFLDEIGDLDLELQCKLLRTLQEQRIRPVGGKREYSVDVRIVAATNKILTEDIASGKFREDLFYRLAVGVIHIPPLREREGDLNLLIDKFLESINQELASQPSFERKTLSAGAKGSLLQYHWPGNVRELENTLKRAALWSPDSKISKQDIEQAIIHIKHSEEEDILKRPLGKNMNINKLLAEVACHYLKRAWEQSGGNKTRAAKLVGLASHETFSNWMKRYKV